MINESGNVSISTENIFPIIKKWLYSEKDIFIRELISNCSDAINKHKKLAAIGEAPKFNPDDYIIVVEINKGERRLSFTDNGIGMTADEVKTYINQIAFSGAQDFMTKYKDKISEDEQIIGHFGLGFYSSFMVAETVAIDTLSWQEGAEAVEWVSVEGMDYKMTSSGRAARGTRVTLTMAEDSQEYLDSFKVREVLRKYCAFMPYPIIVIDRDQEAREAEEAKKKASEAGAESPDKSAAVEVEARDVTEEQPGGTGAGGTGAGEAGAGEAGTGETEAGEAEAGQSGETAVDDEDEDDDDDEIDVDDDEDDDEEDDDDGHENDDDEGDEIDADDDDIGDGEIGGDAAESTKLKKVMYEGKEYVPINDTSPLWQKAPKDCTDTEYKDFYKKVFMDFDDPLFWIHLNMDYPFNLKGILFFPKLRHEFETLEGQIKLYYNQVFVADNIKEVIPEYLLLLKGCLDCPDLPLNVSRSFLQNDSYVKKISTHITKKVGDKLTSLFENSREEYDKYWEDVNPFIKYGCIKDDNLYDRVKDILIYKNLSDVYITLKSYLEAAKEKHANTVFYVTDEKQQAQYVKIFKDNEMDAVILKTLLDTHFIQFLESKDRSVRFQRIDSDISESLKSADDSLSKEDSEKMEKALEAAFKKASGNDSLKIKLEPLKTKTVPAMILLSEYGRRMRDMSRAYGAAGGSMDMSAMFPKEETLVLNRNNAIIKSIAKMHGDEKSADQINMICRHVYDMALLSNQQLDPSAMTDFLERSGQLLEKLL